MLTLINKLDQTGNVPHDSISIDSVQGDPLGKAKLQVIDNNSSIALQCMQEVILIDENVALGGTTLIPAHNYLINNNFTYGSGGIWVKSGTLSSTVTFPSSPTFGAGAHATLTFSNNVVGSVTVAQSTNTNVQLLFPNRTYCFSLNLNITAGFVNSSVFIGIQWLDASNTVISTVQQTYFSNTGGVTRVSITGTAPSNAHDANVIFGGTTTNATNSGTATFTATQMEPVWFPTLYNYPTPICDFLQADSVTLPDGTAARFDRVMTGFITHLTASYEGPVRTWDVEVTAADILLETSALVNTTYTSVTDVNIIQGIVNSLPNTPLFAADPTLQANTPQALAYRNVPVCYVGETVSPLQFADSTIREILNSLVNDTGFIYGVDAYYNVYYYPPFYTQCPYAFSSSPDNVNSFPYYDYSIEYDGTQLHNAIRVVGSIFSTTVTESWHFQDGSHTETVQGGKTVNVYLFNNPNAIPSNVTVGGAGISCGQDTGTGYGNAQSIVTVGTTNYGVPGLLSFPAPGYANGVAISVTYAYNTLAYVEVRSPDSIAQYGRPLYFNINDNNLTSLASCTVRGEAELEEYAHPRVTLKFKVNQLVGVGQVITFTSALDSITAGHYTVQKVTATYLGNKTNQYDVEAGTYVDNFVDFFRNTQKAVNSASHDPAAPIQKTNLLQQDNISFSDSLFIHT